MENVVTDLMKAETTFTLQPGKKLEPAVLRKAVVDAGFTPRDVFVTVRGKAREENGKLIFRPLGIDQVFSLVQSEQTEKLKAGGPKEVGIRAKVIGDKPHLSLEVQELRN